MAMGHHYSVYKGKDKTLFIITPERVIVQTPMQEFYVSTDQWDGQEDLALVSYFIEKGIIFDMRSLRTRIKDLYVLTPTYKRHEVLEVI